MEMYDLVAGMMGHSQELLELNKLQRQNLARHASLVRFSKRYVPPERLDPVAFGIGEKVKQQDLEQSEKDFEEIYKKLDPKLYEYQKSKVNGKG